MYNFVCSLCEFTMWKDWSRRGGIIRMTDVLVEKKINDCPDYCQNRKKISTSDDRLHFLEVNGLCPLCGNPLLRNKGKKTKIYEIAHVYPNSPTPEELIILDGVTVFGNNSESFQNKIALCLNCHKNYDFHKNVEEYNKLLNKKRELYNAMVAKTELASIEMPQRLEFLLKKISTIDISSVNKTELRLTPLEIKQKFLPSESILRMKVTAYVTEYYAFIRNYFKNLEEVKILNFSLLATTIRLAYQTTLESLESKDKIFDALVGWLLSKTNTNDKGCAEIVVSYFIQNCEVFDEVAE